MRNVTLDQTQDLLPPHMRQLFLKSTVEEIQRKYQFEGNFIDEDMQHEVELQLKDINGLLSDIIQSLLMNKKLLLVMINLRKSTEK